MKTPNPTYRCGALERESGSKTNSNARISAEETVY